MTQGPPPATAPKVAPPKAPDAPMTIRLPNGELPSEKTQKILQDLQKLTTDELMGVNAHVKWCATRHKHQIAPKGDWTVWLLLAGRGAGKGLHLATPIPTPAGWKKNGDLQDGDVIFDEQGTPCTVLKAHEPYMPKTMYRLTFSDNSVIEADGDHLWTTLTHRARKQMTRHGIKRVPDDWASYKHPLIACHHNTTGYVGAETLNTEQIVQTFTHGSRGDLNHCIPTTQPLNLPPQELPIDPYLLGLWLGDGASKDQLIWGHADDIGLVEAYAQSLGYETARKHDQGNTWSVRIFGLSKQLKALGVLGNKHVPQAYLRGSIEQRLQLLRGLMDTDGYQSSKAAEFCNTNRALAEAVYELAVSLGEKPVMKEGRAKLYGRDCGEKYRVTWRWNRFNPFKMERKIKQLSAPDVQSFKHGHRMIVSIEPIAPEMVRCITVDSPSRLYLAGEAMIPTHNTRAACEWLWWQAFQRPETRWLVSAPTSADIRDTCFEGDSGLISVMPEQIIKEYNRSLSEIILKNGSLIKGISAETPDRLRGGQWHGAWCHPAGTPVLMADGSEKPIEQITAGEMVQTRFGPHTVTAAGISKNPAPLYRIYYLGLSLVCTADHPVWVLGRGWVPAENVLAGENLGFYDGTGVKPAAVSKVERLSAQEPVYNLTVETVNEYVANGVVVHNCDELAAWQYDQEAWDMIMFALRLGKHPRIVATTTPKPKALIRELVGRDGDDVTVVRASTYENIANLAPTFQKQLLQFEGTTLGRQEIHAEILNPEEQGIIKRTWVKLWPAKKPLPVFEHIVLSLDTAFTEQTRDKKTSDADPSACVVLGLFYQDEKPNIMLLDCWEDRLGMPDLIKRVQKEREVYYGDDEQRPVIKPLFGPSRVQGSGRRPDTIVIEDKGSGISLRQMLAREGIIAHAYNPGKASKLTRLHMVSHLFAGGMVWFVESEKRAGQVRTWAEPLLYQLCAFSGEGSIKHDDLMDACTQGLRFLADKDMISVSKPKPLQPRLIINSRPRENPYGV